jgi:hypothetical protein
VSTRGRRRRRRLTFGRHLAASLALGAARAGLELTGMRPPAALAAMVALRLAPEVVVAPALGAAPPQWRWSHADSAASMLHHGISTAAVEASYRLLRRARKP